MGTCIVTPTTSYTINDLHRMVMCGEASYESAIVFRDREGYWLPKEANPQAYFQAATTNKERGTMGKFFVSGKLEYCVVSYVGEGNV